MSDFGIEESMGKRLLEGSGEDDDEEDVDEEVEMEAP